MFSQLSVKPFYPEYHESSQNFREQIGLLFPAGVDGNSLKMIRSWELVCQPGAASFAFESPGEDTPEGWNYLYHMIREGGARGICHTHPSTTGSVEFSDQDIKVQVGLAKALGKTRIWHVVHSVGSSMARVVCLHMPIRGQVIKYDFGHVECPPEDSVILVPLPAHIDVDGRMITVNLSCE